MKTVGHYLDYMARSFGLAGSSSLEAKHAALFRSYLNEVLEDWENKGDMDYLKQLGFYNTKAAQTGTLSALQGKKVVTLSSAVTIQAVGCDLQVGEKSYIITKYVSSTQVELYPAWVDGDNVAATFVIRYNRFPVPPYFRKILNERLYYVEDLNAPRIVREKDFAMIIKDNVTSRPLWYQIKYTAKTPGFTGSGTVAANVLTVTVGTLTVDMVGLPVRFSGDDETYYLRERTDATHGVLDRSRDTAIAIATSFDIIPQGTYFVEIFPHPDASKQIVFDYLETETAKVGDSEIIQAPQTVLHAALEVKLAKFGEDSAASRQLLITEAEAKKDEAKTKCVSDYTPSVKAYGWRLETARGEISDYGMGDRVNNSSSYDYLRRRRC